MKPGDVDPPARLGHLRRDKRGYPIISTVSLDSTDVNFGSLSERRKLVLATFDWCAVCGLPFGAEKRWQVVPGETLLSPGGQYGFSEAPVHEICLVYAAQVCPYLSSPGSRLGDDLRGGQRRETRVRAAGFRGTAAVQALPSQLQHGKYVLHFAHEAPIDEFSYKEPTELADRYRALRSSEPECPTTPAEDELIRLFAGDDDTGDEVCGAAIMAGAAFAPRIFELRELKVFDKDSYRKMAAVMLLNPVGREEIGASASDAATAAVARWLDERQASLPGVLAGWRKAGRGRVRMLHQADGGPKSKADGPGRSVSKKSPCPCGSGRKAFRCHPAGLATS